MKGRKLTIGAMLFVSGVLSAVEARALYSEEEGDTVSARMADLIKENPVVAGLWVACAVHFSTPALAKGEKVPLVQGTGVAILGGALLGLAWVRRDRSAVYKKEVK